MEEEETRYLLVLLLASVPRWPQPPGVVVHRVGQHHLLGADVHTKLNLKRLHEVSIINQDISQVP